MLTTYHEENFYVYRVKQEEMMKMKKKKKISLRYGFQPDKICS